MSQAEDLLNSLSVGDETAVTDERIVIGTDRFITVPQRLKRIAVEYDHDVETVTFDCPRYWDGRDLTTMKLYINGFRADKEPFCYPIDNGVTIDAADNTMIHFDWIIRREVTEVKGGLVFLVCGKKVDANGNEENHWNSELNKDLYISEGLEVSDVIMNEYPDLVTHLLTRMDVVEYKTTLESMLGYLDTYFTTDAEINQVLKDYVDNFLATDAATKTLIQNIVNDYINNNLKVTDKTLTLDGGLADAAATGDAVRNMVDVTNKTVLTETAAGVMKVNKVFGRSEQVVTSGKNLIPYPYTETTKTLNGITFTDNGDGTITANGTATTQAYLFLWSGVLPIGNYLLSGAYDDGSSATSIYLANGSYSLYKTDVGKGVAVDITTEETISIVININGGTTVSNLVFKPMLRLASITDDTYEPYTGGMPAPNPEYPQEIVNAGADGAVSGKVTGWNLTPGPSVSSNTYGVTYTLNADNSITLNGTATAYSTVYGEFVDAVQFRGKTLALLASLNGVKDSGTCQIRFVDENENVITFRSVISGTGFGTFEVPADAVKMRWEIYVGSGHTVTNVTAYPYTCVYNGKAVTTDDYRPYVFNDFSISTPNGLPGIKTANASLANYTDEDGQMWICDEIDYKRGVYVQRIGKTEFALTNKNTNATTHYFSSTDVGKYIPDTPVVCDKLLYGNKEGGYAYINANSTIRVNIDCLTLDEANARLGVTTLYGILATPIETPIDQIDTLRSYDGGAVIHQDDAVHAGLEVEYPRTLAASYVMESQQDIAELQAPIRTATGEGSIKLTDSAAGGIQLVEMLGKSEQGSLSGKNLVDLSGLEFNDSNYAHSHTTATQAVADLIAFFGQNVGKTVVISMTTTGSNTSDAAPVGQIRLINSSGGALLFVNNGISFDITEELAGDLSTLYIYGSNTGASASVSNIQIEYGSVATEYEPYCGGTPSPNPDYPQEVRSVRGKNLLENTATSQTINGVTFTVNEDGSVVANGTATADCWFKINTIDAKANVPYILSGCPSGGGWGTYYVYVQGSPNHDFGNGLLVEYTEDTKMTTGVAIISGTTVSNLVFKPMIRRAEILDPTYVPYGRLRLKAYGKNLFKVGSVSDYTMPVDLLTIDGDVLNIRKLASNASVIANATNRYKPGQYAISFKNSDALPRMVIRVCDEKGNYLSECTGLTGFTYNASYRGFYKDVDSDIITIPETVAYWMLGFVGKLKSTDDADTIVQISEIQVTEGDAHIPYEPYHESSAILPDPIELNGIGDVVNELSADEVVRKFEKVVFDGSENWIEYGSVEGIKCYWTSYFDSRAKDMQAPMCTQFLASTSKTDVNTMYIGDSNVKTRFSVDENKFPTVDDWKAWLAENPMTITYELAEYIAEPLTPANRKALRSLLSYDGLTYIECDCDLGPEMTWRYGASEVGGLVLSNENLSEANGILVEEMEDNLFHKTKEIKTASTDLNEYVGDGIYYFGSNYTPTNIPAGSNGWLMVMSLDGSGKTPIKQIWYRHGTPNKNDYESYVRTYSSGTWSNWVKNITVSDFTVSGDTLIINFL